MKTYNAEKRTLKKVRELIESAISVHDKYKKCYFWSAPSNSYGRRAMVDRFEGKDFNVFTKYGLVEVVFDFSVSCKNVYYAMAVYLDGEKKSVALLKKLLK